MDLFALWALREHIEQFKHTVATVTAASLSVTAVGSVGMSTSDCDPFYFLDICDPYVIFSVDYQPLAQSPYITNDLSPTWNYQVRHDCLSEPDILFPSS